MGSGLGLWNFAGLVPELGWGRGGRERAATPHFAEPRWQVRESHLIVHRERTSHFGRRHKLIRSSPHLSFLPPSLPLCIPFDGDKEGLQDFEA